MATIASLSVDVIANTGRFVSDLAKASRGVDGFEKKTKASFNKMTRSVKRFSRQTGKELGSLQSAFAAVGIGLAIKEILDLNNTYTAMSNKLRLVTRDSQQLADVQENIFQVSQKTRGSLEATTDLYFRMAKSTEQLGLSQTELLDITETVNNAVAVSGSTAASSAAALFQFGQGLAADALRGQELNSIMEQTPRLAQAIADGLGIEIGALRDVAKEGKLTADVVVKALQSQSAVLEKEFGQTEKTVSQALQQIENVALKTFGALDAKDLISALDTLKETLQDPAVISGLQSIGAGLLNMVNLSAKGAAAFANFGKAIGFMAAKMTGALETPQDELKEIKQRMIELHEAGKTTGNMKPYAAEMQALSLRAGELQKRIQLLSNAITSTTQQAAAAPTTPEQTEAEEKPPAASEDPWYQRRIELNGLFAEADRARTETAAAEAKKREANEMASNQLILSSAGNMYSALSGLMSAMGNDNKKIKMAMLAFEKGLAVAQSIINTQVAVTKANALDPTGVLATKAQIMGNIATGLIAATGVVQAGAIGQAHDGQDYIPRDGSYNLKQGEMVLDKGTSEQVRNNAVGGGGDMKVVFQFLDADGAQAFWDRNRDTVYNTMRGRMFENGENFA